MLLILLTEAEGAGRNQNAITTTRIGGTRTSVFRTRLNMSSTLRMTTILKSKQKVRKKTSQRSSKGSFSKSSTTRSRKYLF
jgi:hypothetical protein